MLVPQLGGPIFLCPDIPSFGFFWGPHVDLTCAVCFFRNNYGYTFHPSPGVRANPTWGRDPYGSTSCDYTRNFKRCVDVTVEKKVIFGFGSASDVFGFFSEKVMSQPVFLEHVVLQKGNHESNLQSGTWLTARSY